MQQQRGYKRDMYRIVSSRVPATSRRKKRFGSGEWHLSNEDATRGLSQRPKGQKGPDCRDKNPEWRISTEVSAAKCGKERGFWAGNRLAVPLCHERGRNCARVGHRCEEVGGEVDDVLAQTPRIDISALRFGRFGIGRRGTCDDNHTQGHHKVPFHTDLIIAQFASAFFLTY